MGSRPCKVNTSLGEVANPAILHSRVSSPAMSAPAILDAARRVDIEAIAGTA
jgi:hypothetical protein